MRSIASPSGAPARAALNHPLAFTVTGAAIVSSFLSPPGGREPAPLARDAVGEAHQLAGARVDGQAHRPPATAVEREGLPAGASIHVEIELLQARRLDRERASAPADVQAGARLRGEELP